MRENMHFLCKKNNKGQYDCLDPRRFQEQFRQYVVIPIPVKPQSIYLKI